MTAPELYTWPTVVNGRWTLRLPAYRAIRYLHEGDWEKERIASMALNIDRADVILDIGAETGDMSALFASWVPDGGIHLVEPNPAAWPGIRFIWEANSLPMPLSTFVGFAAAQPAVAPAENTGGQAQVGKWPPCAANPIDPAAGFRHLAEETDTTASSTIDELVGDARLNAITIDVEGAELEVLRGAREVLLNQRPIVWVSIHPAFMRHHFDQRPTDVRSYMRGAGYEPIHLGDDHESHWMFEPT